MRDFLSCLIVWGLFAALVCGVNRVLAAMIALPSGVALGLSILLATAIWFSVLFSVMAREGKTRR